MTPVALTIYGPNADGTYIVEFRTAAGDLNSASRGGGDRHFQAKTPEGDVTAIVPLVG
jgi:hypothetical protein